MCLTIPAQVLKVEKGIAQIKDKNGTYKIKLGFVNNIKVGDWVLHTVGTVIRKIDQDEANEIIKILKKTKFYSNNLSNEFQNILLKAQQGKISSLDIKYLLLTSGDEMKTLLSEANLTRQAEIRDFFCIHGIIEFSNFCKNDCFYCGIRNKNKELKRYRMSPEAIIKTVQKATKKGYKLIVLQSGEDNYYNDKKLEDIIKKIKKKFQVFIFLSVGERGPAAYKKFKKSGASGVLLRFETSNPKLFKKFHPQGKNFKNRLKHLKFLRKLGYFIATGSIIGLPGQSYEDIVDDILLTSKWADMVSLGPYVLAENTPCAKMENQFSQRERIDLTLKTIAILRLIMKKSRIPVVTAFETLVGQEARKIALQSGANSLMINLTPKKYRRYYRIYNNKFFDQNSFWEKYGLFQEKESFKMLEDRMRKEIDARSKRDY